MPELPDVLVYIERLDHLLRDRKIEQIRIASPFLVRSFAVPMQALEGKAVRGFRRLGKRIVFVLEDELFLVLHLMVAGRLRWRPAGARIPGKVGLAALDSSTGTLIVTEAGTRKRASLHLVRGESELAQFDRGGLEPLSATRAGFATALARERHTLKRALTDPRLFSGIGNAYSDEILHRACLSPLRRTDQLSPEEVERLFQATQDTLREWIERLRHEAGEGFPKSVTAFRPEMAVHGRYGLPCRCCGAPVQRIVYAETETHYCAGCQTGGKLLADRALSRLLRKDWPRRLEDLEDRLQR